MTTDAAGSTDAAIAVDARYTAHNYSPLPIVAASAEGCWVTDVEGNRYLGESPQYKAVGALGIEIGLEWGGSWKSLVDEPHFQLRPAWAAGMAERQMLAVLRERRTAELPVYA